MFQGRVSSHICQSAITAGWSAASNGRMRIVVAPLKIVIALLKHVCVESYHSFVNRIEDARLVRGWRSRCFYRAARHTNDCRRPPAKLKLLILSAPPFCLLRPNYPFEFDYSGLGQLVFGTLRMPSRVKLVFSSRLAPPRARLSSNDASSRFGEQPADFVRDALKQSFPHFSSAGNS